MLLKSDSISMLLKLVKLAYLVSLVGLLISGLLIYINRKNLGAWNTESLASIFVWYTFLFVMWTIIISIPILLIISMYQVIKGRFNWSLIKKEIILLLMIFVTIIIIYLMAFSFPVDFSVHL
jgi:hypothetical protein